MRKTAVYLWLQLKRCVRMLPLILLLTAICSTALGLLLRQMTTSDSDAARQRMTVGVVGDAGDSYLGFGISALRNLDISRYTVELLELTEEEAERGLRSGALSAYVIIPEGFVDAIVHGELRPLTYVSADSSHGITALFKEEMLSAISGMLIESQNGIYAMQALMREGGVTVGWSDHTDTLNVRYFNLILSRAQNAPVRIIGVSDSLSFPGYMLSGIAVLLLFLCGISFCPLFVRRDMALPRRLCAGGQGALSQTLGEWCAYVLFMLLSVLLIFTAVFTVLGDAAALIPELEGFGAAEAARLVLAFVPGILLITALQYLLFLCCDGIVSGVLCQFLSAIALTYIGGCFYPIRFFPDFIQRLSAYLPSGMARVYLAHCLTGDGTAAEVLLLLAVTALFVGLSAAVRRIRMRRV